MAYQENPGLIIMYYEMRKHWLLERWDIYQISQPDKERWVASFRYKPDAELWMEGYETERTVFIDPEQNGI